MRYTFSYMQIYNEQVNDLLESSQSADKLKSLSVLEDSQGIVQIP